LWYARLIIFWNDQGKKRMMIIHFMDDPEETAHTLMEIIHERKIKTVLKDPDEDVEVPSSKPE